MDILESYDSAAAAYAEHLSDELARKPLDRHLLNRFAEETRGRGPVVDLGCGPGHVARYLSQQGVTIAGVDFSAQMVAVARNLNPDIDFRVEDMRQLNASAASFRGVVMFYSIVHFDVTELLSVFRERGVSWWMVDGVGRLSCWRLHGASGRIVRRSSLAGLSAHVPASVVDVLRSAGFAVIEEVHRDPYEGVEYPSRRCYLSHELPNNSMQLTALRAAADAERWTTTERRPDREGCVNLWSSFPLHEGQT